MSFAEILKTLFLSPVEFLFQTIFMTIYRVLNNAGLTIVLFSLAMNIILTPLYKQADEVQNKQLAEEMRLEKVVTHIRKTFKGNEQLMMLQTYYRQNNYKPVYALRGALPLLLEIPFFLAAYNMLYNMSILQGSAWGPIKDLSKADALINISGLTLNLLPVIMTVINIISATIYSQDKPRKIAVQLYIMALVFLLLLYQSPSGLLLYWTCNNIWSLVKNIYQESKLQENYRFQLAGRVVLALLAVMILVETIVKASTISSSKIVVLVIVSLLMFLPLIKYVLVGENKNILRKYFKNSAGLASFSPDKAELESKQDMSASERQNKSEQPNKKVFFVAALYLAVLVGLLIPSGLIADSAQEFLLQGNSYKPQWYLLSSICLALGAFVIWGGVFYSLATTKVKQYLNRIICIVAVAATINYMFFGRKLGNLSADLQFDAGLQITSTEIWLNFIVILAVALVISVLFSLKEKYFTPVLSLALAAIIIMSGLNISAINQSLNSADAKSLSSEMPHFTLSKKGKNVVVIMLDRGMSTYIPYIFNEKPELKKQFAGFTYYRNNISFGNKTNISTPSLFGGYEYTPAKLNARDSEKLVDKHNEALKVMPVLFSEHGYNVNFFDPTYANYQWISDLSVFADCPGVKAWHATSFWADREKEKEQIPQRQRNFFAYAVMKTMPLAVQNSLYQDGNYNNTEHIEAQQQIIFNNYKSSGLRTSFMNCYNSLDHMQDMTSISEGSSNNLLLMTNDITHEPMLLQEPAYEPANIVDNTEYEASHKDRFKLNGVEMKMNSARDYYHYQSNMAALLKLGKWFDYLRANDLYNNTRIILVSDHGDKFGQFDDLILADGFDTQAFAALLMVKDFNSQELRSSDEFMTTADVLSIAAAGLIEQPVNPFTHKPISNQEKNQRDQYVLFTSNWQTSKNNGNSFLPDKWYKVHGNLWDKQAWELVMEKGVLRAEK